MRLTSPDETDLLTVLHDGAFDEPLWSTFLQRLRARAEADFAALIFRSGEGESTELMTLRSVSPSSGAVNLSWVEKLYRSNPRPYRQMRPDRVYSPAELVDMADPARTGFHKDGLQRSDEDYGRLVRVEEPSGSAACCVLARSASDFPPDAGALLSALAPHIRIALRGYVAIQRERLRASISDDVVQRLNLGWLTLDAAGVVVGMNGQAERLLQRSSSLRRTRHGQLLTSRAGADRELAQILRFHREGQMVRPRFIHIEDDPWLDLLVVPVAGDASAMPERPVLAIYLQGDGHGSEDRIDWLRKLFDLSANEARLALSLSRGRSLAEAAGDVGLTLESARTYSKRIYRKTSTRGQTDLVRLILTSVLALA